jgi:hypothetical protein
MATTRSAAAKRPATRGRTQTAKPIGPERDPLANVPVRYHTPIFIGLILLSLLVFFGGVIFSGKIFGASDFISWESFRPFINSMDRKGEAPLWIPYIFSGMPAVASYLLTGDRWWDITMKIFFSIFDALGNPVLRVSMYYFVYGVGMYLLMRTRQAARSTSFFVALAAIFSTWIIIYIMIGHNTKIMTLMTFPYIFICLEKLIKRWSLLYAGLLILAVHILWEAAQANTAFYGACAVGIYLLVELIGTLVAKEKITGIIRAGLALLAAGAFTYGMGLDRNLAVAEYLPYSTRGAGAINAAKEGGAAETEASHSYDYATNWSFSPEEMITYVVPNYYGFGKLSLPEDILASLPQGYNANPEQPKPTYWGQMPFTDAAHYMGIAVLILGIFGAWMNRKNRFVQALLAIGLFGLILSFGKNFSLLYDFFYYNVPSFNKLRAPSQSLVLLEFVFPILAGFGIETLIAMHKAASNREANRSILYTAGAFGAMILIGLIGMGGYNEAVAATSGRTLAAASPKLTEYLHNQAMNDLLLSGFFGIATLLAMYYYLKGRITPTVFKLSLFGILIFDLWRVDYRPMETQPADTLQKAFATTDVDRFLAQDTSQYRILNLISESPNYPAYHFQQHILGYSSAKMRNYQDLLDVAGNGSAPTSPTGWNLLNTKYIIAEGPVAEGMKPVFQSKEKKATVFENTAAMPRAWFVNRVEVADGMTVLNKIKDNAFDPRDVAFIPDSSKALVAGIDPVGAVATPARSDSTTLNMADTTAPTRTPVTGSAGQGSVTVTHFEPLHIAFDVEAPGPKQNFLAISEINYPPCWHATIDGKPAQIIQTDYLLRGVVVPAGKHRIEMNYSSSGFETGKTASLVLNIAMFVLIGAGIVLERRHRPAPDEVDPEHEGPVVAEDDV